MPKVNQTMLDKLVDAFKGGSQRKPEIIQATTIRDPLGYSMVQRRFGTATGKMPSMTPERQMYQEGIEARMQPKYRKADENVNETYENMDAFKDEWNESVEQAKEDMLSDWQDELEGAATDEPYGYSLEVEPQSTNLRDYWPDYGRDPDEIINDFDIAQDRYFSARDERNYLRTPRAWMQEQTRSPRYRRYQEAMRRRDINRRTGRVNAAIMNLARQGYSLPEIREILRRQGR